VLGGTVDAPGIGTIQWNGGTTRIIGSIDNSNSALALSATSGNIVIGNAAPSAPKATITGGTVSTSDGVFLDVAYSSVLEGVTLNGDAFVRPGASLTLDNPEPSTSPARITLNDSTLSVNGTQPLAGPIEVLLN